MDKTHMTALVALGNGQGRRISVPIPQVTAHTVLVRVYYCGICGTDQDLFSGNCSLVKDGLVSYPLRLGHEWSGIVEAVGPQVTRFSPGDAVVGDNAITCGVCDACRQGRYDHCRHMRNVGTIHPVYDGAFAEYFLIPEHHLHKIPPGISLKEACLCEPFSVAYGGIKHMAIGDQSVVAVIGTGCIGMAAAVLAQCQGAGKVIMLGRNDKKLDVARSLGITTCNIRRCDGVEEIQKLTGGAGADFVLECSGAPGTFQQAIALAGFRGVVGLIGFYDQRENQVNVDAIVSKALHLFGVMGEMDLMEGALGIWERRRPNLLPIITDELPFSHCMGGFLRENFPNSIKTVVKIQEGAEDV